MPLWWAVRASPFLPTCALCFCICTVVCSAFFCLIFFFMPQLMTDLTIRASLHENWDEFHPRFFIYMIVFILRCRDVSRPAWVEFILPVLTLHYISSRKDCLHAIFRHVSCWCSGQGWNHVDSNKKMTRHQDEFIPGRKSSQGENSHIKRPLVKLKFY